MSTQATRELSKLLFNAQHRLAVARLFAPPTEVTLTYEEVAQQAATSRSVAHKELGVLVRIGALQRVDIGRTVHYQRVDTPFWPFLTHLLKQAAQQSAQT
jgi:response regulator of citrate/malate metabolism